MTVSCDFSELLAISTTLGIQVWGVSETLIPLETVKELTRLCDETTFLNSIGPSDGEDKDRLSKLLTFLRSKEATNVLSQEGERWRVTSVLTATNDTLKTIGKSLAEDSTPARVGRLLRALPVMAASKFTVLGHKLAYMLEVDPNPESLIVAYGNIFCQHDERILTAIDGLILDDKVLGPVALELAGRLMLQFGYDGHYLNNETRDALVNCLALLIGGFIEKASLSSDETN